MKRVRFCVDEASAAQVEQHLRQCDSRFVPPLTQRIDLGAYAEKIRDHATRFEAWADGVLVGLVAVYLNDRAAGVAHVTNVSVLPHWARRGIASDLLQRGLARAAELRFEQVTLEVSPLNADAVRLYKRFGFIPVTASAPVPTMRLDLCSKGGERHA
ncbi:MAG: GNAT family N-acetyltransferase [Burkholderiaceae bacterium]|nr:GNAT family N-acetyltransferase [Burkholderiaceae bacterium]